MLLKQLLSLFIVVKKQINRLFCKIDQSVYTAQLPFLISLYYKFKIKPKSPLPIPKIYVFYCTVRMYK